MDPGGFAAFAADVYVGQFIVGVVGVAEVRGLVGVWVGGERGGRAVVVGGGAVGGVSAVRSSRVDRRCRNVYARAWILRFRFRTMLGAR